MREVLVVLGSYARRGGTTRAHAFPYAVREWCINTAAVQSTTNSIFTPSEDGRIYRWNLIAPNSLSRP